jgi:hypothetical protein
MNFLERSVETKKIIWFKETNRYMLAEIPAYAVISRLAGDISPEETADWCSEFYNLPPAEARRFVEEVAQLVEQQSVLNKQLSGVLEQQLSYTLPSKFCSTKNLQLNGAIYSFEYETDDLEYQIHPKFAHLEVKGSPAADHLFQVFRHGEICVLRVNGEIIGQWRPEEEHYFSGKFSMELLNRMHRRADNDWMGVFHASAISRKNRCMLFLGDSGSGKSTASAILMANGFDLLADDFVPVDAQTSEVLHFPAAVSIKKNAFDHLIPLYPQLASSAEFEYPGMGKTVRYLPPLSSFEDSPSGYPCIALIFVKYQKNSGLKLAELPKDIAFQYLVPDSWISPLEENATRFLDWFLDLPCYRLTYSDNGEMVSAIEELFRKDK